MKRKFGAMALALSMGLSLTNGVLAAETDFETSEFEEAGESKVMARLVDGDGSDVSGGDDTGTDDSTTTSFSLTDIADDNLKNYLKTLYPDPDTDWGEVTDLYISTINTNGDSAESLNQYAAQIKKLDGLEKLPNLSYLSCYKLSGLDGVSTLKDNSTLNSITITECGTKGTNFSLALSDLINLNGLFISSNPSLNGLSYEISDENTGVLNYISLYDLPELTTLDLTDYENLETFNCTDTPLTSLDLSSNTNLKHFLCSNSSLPELDFTNNPLLETLDCSNNLALKTLSLKADVNTKLQSLNCSSTKITALNLEDFENLRGVTCSDCPELWTATVKNCPELYSFSNTNTPALKNLNVRGCPKLDKKSITRNENLTIDDDPVETKYDYTVKGIEDSYWQTGSAIEPKPVLKYGTYTLKEGKDYTLSYKNNVDGPKGSVIIKGKGVYGGVNKTVTFKIEKTDRMNRLYNPNSGEHFYTASTAEKNHLVKLGWRAEGIGWTSPKTSKTPVYRLYNPNAGDHHYTMSSQEKDMLVSKGWRYEGVAFYSGDSDGVAVYRQYNPNAKAGAHNYTPSFAEHNYLVNVGWHGEGVAWYGVSND